MAILNRLVKLPNKTECQILDSFSGELEISHPKLSSAGFIEKFFLTKKSSNVIACIEVDYDDVKFKFECLFFTLKNINSNQFDGIKKLTQNNWQQVKPIFRAEWERPALPGEVPTDYEQIVQCRGKLSDVPNESPACVSMVGILFAEKNTKTQGLVYLNDDFPLALGYTENSKQIDQYLTNSWATSVDEVASLRNELNDWVE